MRGRAALVCAWTVVGFVGLAPGARAQEVTTTTILPILVPLHVSPRSGPAGAVVSVQGDGCDTLRGGAFATVDFDESEQNVAADSEGAWSTTVTIPIGAAVGAVFTIRAVCANSETTVFHYEDAAFTVAAPVPTSAVTTSTTDAPAPTATTPTTITSPPLRTRSIIPVDPTLPTTVGPTSELPHTGANDATGLTLLALSLVAAGGLLLLRSRRR